MAEIQGQDCSADKGQAREWRDLEEAGQGPGPRKGGTGFLRGCPRLGQRADPGGAEGWGSEEGGPGSRHQRGAPEEGPGWRQGERAWKGGSRGRAWGVRGPAIREGASCGVRRAAAWGLRARREGRGPGGGEGASWRTGEPSGSAPQRNPRGPGQGCRQGSDRAGWGGPEVQPGSGAGEPGRGTRGRGSRGAGFGANPAGSHGAGPHSPCPSCDRCPGPAPSAKTSSPGLGAGRPGGGGGDPGVPSPPLPPRRPGDASSKAGRRGRRVRAAGGTGRGEGQGRRGS